MSYNKGSRINGTFSKIERFGAPQSDRRYAWRSVPTTNTMTDKTKLDPAAAALENTSPDPVPDWLSGRLRRMFTDVMDEPVPDEFKALLKQLEDKERGP
jgi:hypothetical protein